jgi:hypothetical protein
VATNAEPLNPIPARLIVSSGHRSWLQRLIDSGTLYVPQTLSPTQFATLDAIARLLLVQPTAKYLASRVDAALVSSIASSTANVPPLDPYPPITFDYQLGLDELDQISRIRTTYPFAELTVDLQEAILRLIATRDLTTRKLDLALWLEDLRRHAAIAV